MEAFEIVDAVAYRVILAAPVKRGPVLYRPRDRHRMKGAILRELVDGNGWEVIADASAVS